MIEKVKIPETVADMPISKAKFFVELTELAGENVEPDFLAKLDAVQVSDLNAVFFESAPDHFDRYTDYSNRVILANILESASKYTENKPRAEIVDNGTKYVLNLDFTDQPVSFHRDIKSIDPRTGMVDIIGMMYIEDGLVYNEIDKSNKIKNPRRERGEILEKHFNLAQYLDLKAFFAELERVNALFKRTTKGTGSKEKKWDWEKSIDYVAKRFNTTWEDVVSWNIVVFMYKSDFIQDEIAEERLRSKK